MRIAIITLAILVGGCGGGMSGTTNDSVGQNVAVAASEGKSAKQAAALDCSNLPKFVPIYPGGRVTECLSSPDGTPNHVSGNLVYRSDAQPEQVLGWSRAQSDAAGLGHRVSEPGKYSAGEEGKRTLIVVVEPMDGGTRASVNWGSEI